MFSSFSGRLASGTPSHGWLPCLQHADSGAPSDAGRSLSESWLTRPFISGGHLAVAVAPCGAQGLGSSTWKGAHEPLSAVSARPLGDQYALKMRLVDHVFDEQVIDSLTVKIILPEGAK